MEGLAVLPGGLDAAFPVRGAVGPARPGEGFQHAVEPVAIAGTVGAAHVRQGADHPHAAVPDPLSHAGGKIPVVQRHDHGGEDELVRIQCRAGVDHVRAQAVTGHGAIEGILHGGHVFPAFHHLLAFVHVPGKGGEVNGRVGANPGAGEEAGGGVEAMGHVLHFAHSVHIPAGGIDDGSMHQFVSRPVGAPEPVHIGLTTQGDGQPGIGSAIALGLDGLGNGRAAVPAGGGFGVPEGMLLQGAQVIEPEGAAVEVFGHVIMIELHDVQLFGELAVIHAVDGHGVRAHGNLDVFVQNFRLTVHEFHMGIVLENSPFLNQVGIVPRVPGRGNFGKIVVPLAEEIQIPGLIQTVDGLILFPKAFPEFGLAIGAEAAVAEGIDFVVDLPADDGGIVGEFLSHFFHDAQAVGVVMGVVGAAVPPAAVGEYPAVFVFRHYVGIEPFQPAGRRGGGGAQHHGDAGRGQLVHDLMKIGKVEFAGMGLHAVPGEFRDAGGIDADFLHAGNVFVHFLVGPVFGIIRYAEIGLFGGLKHVMILLFLGRK